MANATLNPQAEKEFIAHRACEALTKNPACGWHMARSCGEEPPVLVFVIVAKDHAQIDKLAWAIRGVIGADIADVPSVDARKRIDG